MSSLTRCGCSACWCILVLLTGVSPLSVRLFCLLARLRSLYAFVLLRWCVFARYVRLFVSLVRLTLCGGFAYWCVSAYCMIHMRLFCLLVRLRLRLLWIE